ncbi:MAG: fibronectin type III domain-containing protein [Bacteroidota bacterium]|nr:fibronectin type III domain-containing protein [Bacteroidota bacterium]
MKTLLITFLLPLLACINTDAQVFPVRVTTQLTPPYSPYLSDYTSPGSQNFMIQVQLNDVTVANYPCRLRLTIEGVGITLRTKTGFGQRPLILQGGVPQIFYGEDIREYFHPASFDFSGLSRSAYDNSARLPEGVYRFSVEVLDYNRGTVVSNAGTTVAWIILNDPPILNQPLNLSTVKVTDPANILFSWTPRHTASPNAAFTTEYTFRLIELWSENSNPQGAFLTQLPLYEETTRENQLFYGMGQPALLPGRRYAWQVEARDAGGKDLFKNQGRSEVFVFQYGEALPVPDNLRMRWAKPTTLAIQWDGIPGADGEIRYRLQYRQRRRTESHEWYEAWTRFTERTFYHLQPGTEYEMKIRSENALQESEYSEIRVFKTLREEADVFVCRDDIDPPPLPESNVPLFHLSINDTIHAGGYDVLVRDVMKVENRYYGAGLIIIPWFNSAKVRATFEKIAVNEQFWLTSGTIKSVWNHKGTYLIEEQSPITPGDAPHAGEIDITVVTVDSVVTIEGAAIASVTTDDSGNTVVITTDGREQTIPMGKSVAIVDDTGSGYVVDNKGNIAKTTAAEARAAAARGGRAYDIAVEFARGGGRYGFDAKKLESLSRYYQQLDNGDYVPWKALSSAQPDFIEGRITSPDIAASKVSFQWGDSPLTPVVVDADKAVLSLQGKVGGMEEELLALISRGDTIPPKVLGKVNLATYNPVRYNLAIVPVNGVAIPGDLDEGDVSGSLNEIYSQAVVEWNVKFEPGLTVPLGKKFDDGEPGLLSNYSDDMKKVLSAFGPLRDNTYYLFIIAEPRNESTLGYMPRNRRAGFLFAGPHRGDAREFLKTIAHELGHGAFNLKHTFDEHNLPPGTTDNVMDYSDGSALYKYQWDYIHEPRTAPGLFEGGEERAVTFSDRQLALEQAASAIREEPYREWMEKLRKVCEFLERCDDHAWQSYNGSGIVPYCFWRDSEISSSDYYSALDLPFTAGLIDGAYREVDGYLELPQVLRNINDLPGKVIYAYTAAHWQCEYGEILAKVDEYEAIVDELARMDAEGGIWNWVKRQVHDYREDQDEIVTYITDCRDAAELRQAIDDLAELATSWNEFLILSARVYSSLETYWETIQSTDNHGRYELGSVIIPAASVILPMGMGIASKAEKVKASLKVLLESGKEDLARVGKRVAEVVSKGAKLKLNVALKEIYDQCIRAGYLPFEEGAEILFKSPDLKVIAKISNEGLSIKVPEKHGTWALQSTSLKAINTLDKANNGAPVYRVGTTNISSAAEAQYWSLENPLDFKDIKAFAMKYGIPEENLKPGNVFVEIGTIKKNIPHITRETPGFGFNVGGNIEVVVPENGVQLESFHVITF